MTKEKFTTKEMATVCSDLAVIKNEIRHINSSLKVLPDVVKRVNDVENAGIKTAEKVSNLSMFQLVFTTIIGGIATYLGVRSK